VERRVWREPLPPDNHVKSVLKVHGDELANWLLSAPLHSYPRREAQGGGGGQKAKECQKPNVLTVGMWPLCQISRTSG